MASLIPWREREVDRFRDEIDKMFRDFFTRSPFSRAHEGGDWLPAIDMSESEKEIVVNAEIPGMDGKDIDISLNGRVLTIKGERKQEKEGKEKNYHFLERRYGTFSRSFELPADVDSEKIKASYKDGVLKINLPKTTQQTIKRIEVKTS